MELFFMIVSGLLIISLFIVALRNIELNKLVTNFSEEISQTKKQFTETTEKLEHEVERNKTLLSQKTSQNVRMGAIAENLLPLLTDLPYNPKNLHHLAQPIDFIHFDYDDASITFVEVKSGNARESARQKLIRNTIKEGKVYYDLVQITENGIKVTRKV